MAKANKKTREEWLNVVARGMEPWFSELGHKPVKYRVSIGFTSHGKKGARIGECWCDTASGDKTHEIFIKPSLAAKSASDAVFLAHVVCHELVHAHVGLDKKHGRVFKKCALALGLEGKMTATVPGVLFKKRIKAILKQAGKLPHAALRTGLSSGPPTQTTRLKKCECPECGYTVRTTQKWLDEGMVTCPCGSELIEV